jgi:Zn-dependent peptidase ImmA (M78 family)
MTISIIQMSLISKANARKLIEKYCLEKPEEINLPNIIYAENLVLKEEELDSCEGKIIFDSEKGIVTINNKIKEQSQKNFVMAHELGHFINEALTKPLLKGEAVFKCGFEDFYGKNKTLETDANDFAAELLMPENWMIKVVKGKMLNGKLIEDTAKYFNVSLTAAAIRYSEVGTRECAVVLSKDGFVKWSSINKSFKYQFIRPKNKVNSLSYTYDFFKGSAIPNTEEEIPAEAWFNECYNIDKKDKVYEFNVPMPRYNSVLSLIWMR